jgi:hypothetical protein
MKDPNEMYNRAVLLAEANGFEVIAKFVYYQKDGNSSLGLKIQPYLNHGVSIQVRDASEPSVQSDPIILSPLDRALLEPIIKAIAFAAKTK